MESEGETRHFEVNKYVLPRFKVEIIRPAIIYYADNETISINVCAKYSHGGNVKGTAFLRLSDTESYVKPFEALKKVLPPRKNNNKTSNFRWRKAVPPLLSPIRK